MITVALFVFLISKTDSMNLIQVHEDDLEIIGGHEVEPHSIPFQVIITRPAAEGDECGGVVLDERSILTACHCCKFEAGSYRITAGDHDIDVDEGTEQTRIAKELFKHPGCNLKYLYNDVCVIKLAEPLVMNEYVQPAELPKNSSTVYAGEGTVSGWGITKQTERRSVWATTLQAAKVPIVNLDDCKKKYNVGADRVKDTNVCAGSSEANFCNGDSGGPLVCDDGSVCGIVSWSHDPCVSKFPGVYALTTRYLKWIASKMDA